MVMHAITSDGWLAPVDPDGKQSAAEMPGEWTKRYIPHAENVRVSGKPTSDDYHVHYDNAMMLKWCSDQLFPAFWTRYGTDMKMYCVMDNSKNQAARREDYVPPNSAKPKLVAKLREHGVLTIRVPRTESYMVRYEEGECEDRRQPKRKVKPPAIKYRTATREVLKEVNVSVDLLTANELQMAIRELYRRQPDLTLSGVELVFSKGGPDPVRQKKGPLQLGGHSEAFKEQFHQTVERHQNYHKVIWTPPYHSECNPIELCWAVAKDYVKKHSFHGRTLSDVRSDLMLGMYGHYGYAPGNMAAGKHAGVTRDMCRTFVESTISTLNQWIASHPRLETLFGTKTKTSLRTIDHLTAAMRSAYGPTVAIHKPPTGKKKTVKEPTD